MARWRHSPAAPSLPTLAADEDAELAANMVELSKRQRELARDEGGTG